MEESRTTLKILTGKVPGSRFRRHLLLPKLIDLSDQLSAVNRQKIAFITIFLTQALSLLDFQHLRKYENPITSRVLADDYSLILSQAVNARKSM